VTFEGRNSLYYYIYYNIYNNIVNYPLENKDSLTVNETV